MKKLFIALSLLGLVVRPSVMLASGKEVPTREMLASARKNLDDARFAYYNDPSLSSSLRETLDKALQQHYEIEVQIVGESYYEIAELIDSTLCQVNTISLTRGGGDNGCNYSVCLKENTALLKTLLQRNGLSINMQDSEGRTLLMYAAEVHLWEFMTLLIEAGADITLRERKGRTALDLVLEADTIRQSSDDAFDEIQLEFLIMGLYYSKERHNKCIDLLTKDPALRLKLYQSSETEDLYYSHLDLE